MILKVIIAIFILGFLLLMYSLMKMASISDERMEELQTKNEEQQESK
ncbi:MAG: hypothetical protein ACI4DS_00420 [Eubacterium sp.]